MNRPLTAHQLAALRMIRVGAPTLYEIGDSLGLGGTRGGRWARAKKIVRALERRGMVERVSGVPVCTPAGVARADAPPRVFVAAVRCVRCNAARFGVDTCPMCGKRVRRAA